MVPLIVLSIILAFLTLDYAVERAAQVRLAARWSDLAAGPQTRGIPDSPMAELPAGLFIGPGHVWVRLDAEGTLRVGIDRLLLAMLGGLDAVYTLKEGDQVVEQGPLVMLRRDDRALKVCSPVAGRVTAVNARLLAAPAETAHDPFGDGWIYELKRAPASESVRRMLSGDRARRWMSREVGRLRDLLQELMGRRSLGAPTLADGGDPSEQFAEQLGDPEWEELLASFFQTCN